MKRRSPSRRSFLKVAGAVVAGAALEGCKAIEITPSLSPTPSRPPSATATAISAATTTPIPSSTPLPSSTPTPKPTITTTPTGTSTLSPQTTVVIVQANSYDRPLVRRQVQAALEAIGGVGDMLRPGARVALKVNLTGGTWGSSLIHIPAVESWVTHPEVVRALGELLLDAGAKELFIVEAVADDQSFSEWGYEEIAQSLAATLVDLNQPLPYSGFTTVNTPQGWSCFDHFVLNPILAECDVFVSLPKLKCHWTCGVTLAMKNLVGITPIDHYRLKPEDTYRSSLHSLVSNGRSRLPQVVVDLLLARPIHLSLVDGIKTVDGGEGPWQDISPQEAHVLIAGKNPVATDAVATAVMGFDPRADYPHTPFLQTYNHLNLAAAAGLGTNQLEAITITGAPVEMVQRQFRPSE